MTTTRRQALLERRQRVAHLNAEAYSNAEISEMLGLAIHLVKGDLQALGITTKQNHQRTLARAVRLLKLGRPVFEVSALCDLPLTTIVRITDEQGIDVARNAARHRQAGMVRARVRVIRRARRREVVGSTRRYQRRPA